MVQTWYVGMTITSVLWAGYCQCRSWHPRASSIFHVTARCGTCEKGRTTRQNQGITKWHWTSVTTLAPSRGVERNGLDSSMSPRHWDRSCFFLYWCLTSQCKCMCQRAYIYYSLCMYVRMYVYLYMQWNENAMQCSVVWYSAMSLP